MINFLYFQGICLQQINENLFNLGHHWRFRNHTKSLNTYRILKWEQYIGIPVSISFLLTSQTWSASQCDSWIYKKSIVSVFHSGDEEIQTRLPNFTAYLKYIRNTNCCRKKVNSYPQQQTAKHWPKTTCSYAVVALLMTEEGQKLNCSSPPDFGAARWLCHSSCNTAEALCSLICHNTTQIPRLFSSVAFQASGIETPRSKTRTEPFPLLIAPSHLITGPNLSAQRQA